MYRAAQEVLSTNTWPANDAMVQWGTIFQTTSWASINAFAKDLIAGGDGILERIRSVRLCGCVLRAVGCCVLRVRVFSYLSVRCAVRLTGDFSACVTCRYHIKSDDFHCAEQIDKSTGAQTSASDLTWCVFACVHFLHSLLLVAVLRFSC